MNIERKTNGNKPARKRIIGDDSIIFQNKFTIQNKNNNQRDKENVRILFKPMHSKKNLECLKVYSNRKKKHVKKATGFLK